jgi:spore coat polysaccharide biosynthesis protein SpsF
VKIAAIIQARMASQRLPGKVLREIEGRPMLAWAFERTRMASIPDDVIVATTTHPEDDPLEDFCRVQGWPCYRGSSQDVLDRYIQAARQHKADVVVRITADCPFIDPGLIDQTAAALLEGAEVKGNRAILGEGQGFGYDFCANRLPPPWGRTYPIGLDVEACRFAALEQAWLEADQPYQREHVMPYLYEDSAVIDSLSGQMIDGPKHEFRRRHPFKVLLLNHRTNYGELRWTVDTPEDLELASRIAQAFPGRIDFSWLEILDLVQKQPELSKINAGIQHKTAYDVDERGDR